MLNNHDNEMAILNSRLAQLRASVGMLLRRLPPTATPPEPDEPGSRGEVDRFVPGIEKVLEGIDVLKEGQAEIKKSIEDGRTLSWIQTAAGGALGWFLSWFK
ncbi:MAG: hypothetical protein ABT940_06725 [Alphaproteobacteria bacterium]